MLNVLLVEDEYIIRHNVQTSKIWAKGEFKLIGTCSDGEEALKFLQDHQVDIMITDIRMPFMDGLALSDKAKKHYPNLYIIILSGFDDFEYAQQALKIGVKEYLTKPLVAKDLLSSLVRAKSEIFNARREAQTFDELISIRDQSRRIRIERMLSEVTTGFLTKKAIMERSCNLNIKFDSPYYVCVIASLFPGGSQSEDDFDPFKAVDLLTSLRFEERRYYIFSITPGEVRFIFPKESKTQAKNDVKSDCSWLQIRLSRTLGINSVFAIGSVVNDVEELSSSFSSAACVMRYISKIRNAIIDADDSESCIMQTTSSLNTVRDLIRNLLSFGDEEDVEFTVQKILDELLPHEQSQSLLLHLIVELNEQISDFLENIHLSDKKPELTGSTLKSLANYFQDAERNSIANALIESLSRAISLRVASQGSHLGDIVRAALEYMKLNFTNTDLTLTTVSGHVNISPSYFSSLFRQETGVTFIEHLTSLRIERAKELLIFTNLRSNQVSYEVGFGDPNYFGKVFRRYVGMTPTKFRQTQLHTN